MKKVFALSTGTVGGAFVMLLFTALLGDKAPWFVEKLHASVKQVYSITLSVDDIFEDLSSLKINDPENYHLDRNNQFYLQLPSKDWSVSVRDPGEFLNDLSIADIPFLHHSIESMGTMFQAQIPQKGDVTTTNFSYEATSHKISFTEESKFDGILLRVNPFDDQDYVNASIRAGGKMMGFDSTEIELVLAGETEEARAEYNMVWDQMREIGNNIIEMNWPDEISVQTAVTVTTFRPRLFSTNPVAKILEVRPEQSLYSLLGYLQFVNPEILSQNLKNVAISRNNKVILFDTTFLLENVLVDDKEVEKVELVKVFLIAKANDLIYVVKLEYLHGIGTSRQSALEAEQLFLSFHILV